MAMTIKAYFEGEKIKIIAQIVDSSYVYHNSEVVVYSVPIVLYKNVSNPIKIQCLNSDQKRVDVSNIAIQLGVFECNSENELINIAASNVDSANGVIEATLTSSQLSPLSFKDYEIALIGTDQNSNVYPIYIDDNYGSRLKATLKKGPVLAYGDPIPVTFLDSVGIGVVSNSIDLTNRPQNSSLATLCANLQAYTGNIIASGSLTTTPFSTDWANISSQYYSNVSGYVFQSVLGKFAEIRFILDSADPTANGNVSPSTFVTNANIRI